jgi:hypothetical protein
MALTPLKVARGEGVGGALRRGNQGSALRLQLGIFKVQSCAEGQPESTGFSGGTVGLRRRGRRVMTGGAHLSARRGEMGALSCDGDRNWAGC